MSGLHTEALSGMKRSPRTSTSREAIVAALGYLWPLKPGYNQAEICVYSSKHSLDVGCFGGYSAGIVAGSWRWKLGKLCCHKAA